MWGCRLQATLVGNLLRGTAQFGSDGRRLIVRGVMRWFRTHGKFGGRLALFALALQFYLSFAHIHPDDIYGPVGQALSAAEAVNLPAAESFKPIPVDQPWYSGDALCPICETIYFLSTSFTPDAPEIRPQTFASWRVEHSAIHAALLATPRRAPFQSRAPPLA
jgi:hypothetical protein